MNNEYYTYGFPKLCYNVSSARFVGAVPVQGRSFKKHNAGLFHEITWPQKIVESFVF